MGRGEESGGRRGERWSGLPGRCREGGGGGRKAMKAPRTRRHCSQLLKLINSSACSTTLSLDRVVFPSPPPVSFPPSWKDSAASLPSLAPGLFFFFYSCSSSSFFHSPSLPPFLLSTRGEKRFKVGLKNEVKRI